MYYEMPISPLFFPSRASFFEKTSPFPLLRKAFPKSVYPILCDARVSAIRPHTFFDPPPLPSDEEMGPFQGFFT